MPEMETVLRLAVVVKVIEVTSTLPASCPPRGAGEEAKERLEDVEDAGGDDESNTNPVDLAAVCVSVTVTRANVPLSAL